MRIIILKQNACKFWTGFLIYIISQSNVYFDSIGVVNIKTNSNENGGNKKSNYNYFILSSTAEFAHIFLSRDF